MTIAKRVTEATERMQKGDYEGALFQICSALEATAKSEYGQSGRAIYKRFIHENLELITRVGFRQRISNLTFGIDLNKFRSADDQIEPDGPGGNFTIEQILYHLVRCDLYHNAGLPPHIEFSSQPMIKCQPEMVSIPGSIVNGLILAVVASPANAGMTLPVNFEFDFTEGVKIRLSSICGKRETLKRMIDAIDSL